MATVTNVKPIGVPGDLWYAVNEVTLDTSYPTGGEAISLQDLGFGPEAVHLFTIATIKTPAGEVNQTNVNYDGSKLLVYNETPAQVANEANLNGTKVQLVTFVSGN